MLPLLFTNRKSVDLIFLFLNPIVILLVVIINKFKMIEVCNK